MGGKTNWVFLAENLLLSILGGPSVTTPVSCPALQGSPLLQWSRCLAGSLPARVTWGDKGPLCWYLGMLSWKAKFLCQMLALFQLARINLLAKALGESYSRYRKMSVKDLNYHKLQIYQELSKQEDKQPFPGPLHTCTLPATAIRAIKRHSSIQAFSGEVSWVGEPPLNNSFSLLM